MMPKTKIVFVIGTFGFKICFKFRVSDFEFLKDAVQLG